MTSSKEPLLGAEQRRWGVALLIALANGVLFVGMAGGEPPVPIPGLSSRLFWIEWAPLSAVAVLTFLWLGRSTAGSSAWRFRALGAAAAIGAVGAAMGWGRTDDVAALLALHLPLLAWATIGLAVAWGESERAQELYAYAVQSLETLVTGGIFLGMGGIFGGLTLGLLAVFDIELSEPLLRALAGFGIGVIPVLAVAVVYDPSRSPDQQTATGLARILRITTWLLLPAATLVLTLYVGWIIPTNFWRPFEEREILLVYNITILAVLVLLVAAASAGAGSGGAGRIQRLGMTALMALTALLNVYALAAILSRTLAHGLTPNRHAVLGWNAVTLVVIGILLVENWRAGADDWLPVFRSTVGRVLVLPIGWAAWVLVVLPLM